MYPLYNKTEKDMYLMEEAGIQRRIKEAYDKGRQAGFKAGYAAASNKAPNDVEAAYEQGKAAAAKLIPIRKNGVGY